MNIKYLIVPGMILGLSFFGTRVLAQARRSASGSTSVKSVRLLAISDWSGDAGFRRRLQSELKTMGFRFVPRSRAQAFVSARTSWKRGGFSGEMWIRTSTGRLLWHERAYRPPSSGYMASDRLATSLRAALGR